MALNVKIPHEARTWRGKAIPGAQLTLTKYPSGAATVYTSASIGTTLSQPLYADQNGRFAGYVPPGPYIVTIAYGGDTEVRHWVALTTNQDSWTEITSGYSNGWGPFSGRTPRYRKTAEGFVELQGAIGGGTLSAAAFTLPAGYRPTEQFLYGSASFGGIGRGEITTGGVLTPQGASNALITLACQFYAGF